MNPPDSHAITGDILTGAFALHHAPLLRYATRLVGDADRAQDIVQDTFVRLMAQPPDTVDGHLVEWLYTVCRHRAVDVLRQEGRMKSLDTLPPDALPPPPSLAPAPPWNAPRRTTRSCASWTACRPTSRRSCA
jgi:DNA-directed RNA polymerase specialized sigma24 family protein